MEIWHRIVRLFCVLIACAALEAFAGKSALRRGRPQIDAEPVHHRSLVGSISVKQERPGLLDHLAHLRKRRLAANNKVATNADTAMPSEVHSMQEADRVAEAVLKDLDDDDVMKDDDKDDPTAVTSTEDAKAAKVETPEPVVEASTNSEVKPSIAEAHVEKLTRRLHSVKETWAAAQAEVYNLEDKVPQTVGAEVAKLEAAKDAENQGASVGEEESLYKWAKSEADRVADKVSSTADKQLVTKATVDATSGQEKAVAVTEDRDDDDAQDDDDSSTQASGVHEKKVDTATENAKSETSSTPSVAHDVINRIKATLAASEESKSEEGSHAAADDVIKRMKAQIASRESSAVSTVSGTTPSAMSDEDDVDSTPAALKDGVLKMNTLKAAMETVAEHQGHAASAKKTKTEARTEDAAAASTDKSKEDDKSEGNVAPALKPVVKSSDTAVAVALPPAKPDSAVAVAAKAEDGDDADDADEVIAPAVPKPSVEQRVSIKATQPVEPTLSSAEPVHLAIGGARAVSVASSNKNAAVSANTAQLSDKRPAEAVETVQHSNVDSSNMNTAAHTSAEELDEAQPTDEDLEETTMSSQDSEENVGWTDDELAEQDEEEEDSADGGSDHEGMDMDMDDHEDNLDHEDQEEHDQEPDQVNEDEEDEGQSEADLEEDVEEALLQIEKKSSTRNLRRTSPLFEGI